MQLLELFNEYKDCSDEARAFVLLSAIIEEATIQKDEIKPILEENECQEWWFDDIGKKLSLIEIQKSTLDVDKVKEQLSDEEIRSVYKPTETNIKTLKRKDLLTGEYKSIQLIKQLRVTKMEA